MSYSSTYILNGLSQYFLQGKLNNIQDRESLRRRTFLITNGSVLPLQVFILCLKLTLKTFCGRETCLQRMDHFPLNRQAVNKHSTSFVSFAATLVRQQSVEVAMQSF